MALPDNPAPGSPGPAPAQAPPGSLVDQAMKLKQQGMSNNQIVQTLVSQGNNYPDVFNAMSQADAMGGQAAAVPATGAPMPVGGPPGALPAAAPIESTHEKIEEVAESIIEEKWDELVKNMNKVIEWKNKTETRMAQIEQKLKDIQASFDELHKAVLGKVSEYDKNIQNVGTELKAMGKVFEKIIPTLTENVNELSRMTETKKK